MTKPYLVDGVTETPYPLGRIEVPDERDRLFAAPQHAPVRLTDRTHNYHRAGWRGDQGKVKDPDGQRRSKPWCVAFAGMHLLEMMHRPGIPDTWDMRWTYHECQKIDQWVGEDYDGTSVRAWLALMKREGVISGYFWVPDARTALDYIVDGDKPVIVGSKWTWDMFEPDADGFLWPTGGTAGGHAWVANGGNRARGEVEKTGSWGLDWGDRGRAKMKVAVLDELIQDHGEAAVVELAA